MQHAFTLRYDRPADKWRDALPLGNGRLGAMTYGHVGIERIQLNDDSLWYGKFTDRNNPSFKDKLPEIRRRMLAGDIQSAERLILQNMAGSPSGMRHYSPLGELDIALNQHLPFTMGWIPHSAGAEDYISELDLITGVLSVTHVQNGVRYRREMFISYPAQVMCIRFTADRPGTINLAVMMNRTVISDAALADDRRPGHMVSGGGWLAPNADFIRTVDDKTILMRGHESEVEFAAAARVVCDGALENPVSQLLVRGCGSVVFYLTSSTSNRSNDPVADALARLDTAAKKGYAALYEEHIRDFSALMERCLLDLGPSPDKTTDRRLEDIRAGKVDPALAALYFQYGRYLTVSGGRENSAALNLQGIWNADFMPMWDSKYTLNINLQMNYWLVEAGNLSPLHRPLMELLKKMHERGRDTAGIMYGMRGMVCHHNTDYYGDCAPQDLYLAAMPWVTGGAWLGLHVWEHYLYTQDLDFLREMYPILWDIALFYEDFLMEADGKLVTAPSTSPENRYLLPDGYDTPLCVGPAMDNQILREFYSACIQIQRLLGVDGELSETLAETLARLPQDQIGSKGQLLEWDRECPELTPGMGHISHLFACYPGSSINWRDTPDLMRAVRTSLELREEHGAGKSGWPLAWFLNMYARLLDGEATDRLLNRMLADSSTRSLLNAMTVFQIDGNLGVAAGIAECLLQSHIALHFLPALPTSWKGGSVAGLCARGAMSVDILWKDGRLTEAVVRPQGDGPIEVVGEKLHVSCDGTALATTETEIGFVFLAEGGKRYKLVPVSC